MELSRNQKLCLAGLAASGLYLLATIPLAPQLLGSHPVLLEAIRGSTPAMVAGGAFARVGEASLVLALIAPLLTLMWADPLLWWAGRLWGPDAARMFAGRGPRAERWISRAHRWSGRYESWAIVLAYFLPVPSALIYAAAGWAGMTLRRFVLLDFVGTSLWIGLNVGLGYAVGQDAVDIAKAISRYGLILTLVLVVVVIIVALRRGRMDPDPEPGSGAPPPGAL